MSEEHRVARAVSAAHVGEGVTVPRVDSDANLTDDELREALPPEDLAVLVADAVASLDHEATEARRLGRPEAEAMERERDGLIAEVFALSGLIPSDAPAAPPAPPWGVGDTVRIADKWSPAGEALALVMAEDPARPNVVKVKYLHSRTAAWVARDRVLGPVPTGGGDQGVPDVEAVRPHPRGRAQASPGARPGRQPVTDSEASMTTSTDIPRATDGIDAGFDPSVPIDSIRPNPRQVRKKLPNLDELADSIREVGVLEPVTIFPDGEGGWFLKWGHRRHAAAKLAGLTTIPAIKWETADSPGHQLVQLLTENGQREPVTELEEAEAVQALLALGEKAYSSQAKVARALGVPSARVKALVAVGKVPDKVKAKLHEGQITLEAAEDLAEFADYPGAVDRLTTAVGTGDWDWMLREERQRREMAKQRAALMAQLEKDGVRVIPKPEDDVAAKEKPVHWLFGDEGQGNRLDAEAHRSCPYHAVVAYVLFNGEVKLQAYCTDPEAAGHHVSRHLRPGEQQPRDGQTVSAEQVAREREREEREQREAIASGLRADFLANVNLKDKANALQALRMLTAYYIPRFLERQEFADRDLPGLTLYAIEDVARALNVTVPKATHQGRPGTKAQAARDLGAARDSWVVFQEAIARATSDQLLHALLSIIRHDLESLIRRPYGDRRKEGPAYLAAVDAWGYQPSEAEKALRGDHAREVAEAAAEEAWDVAAEAGEVVGDCPECGEPLVSVDGESCRCPKGHEFPVEDGPDGDGPDGPDAGGEELA
jgi:ParB family transcriptional regulator, chromosome partitioning protein